MRTKLSKYGLILAYLGIPGGIMRVYRVIKEYLILIVNNIILLTGTGLFMYGLFGFSSSYYSGYTSGGGGTTIKLDFSARLAERTFPIATYYYYEPGKIQILIIGAILIVIGLLIRAKSNEKKL